MKSVPFDRRLTEVFVSIRGGLVRAVGGIVPPREIEDVIQETYVRVCQTGANNDIRSPQSFMYKTARNIALNYLNKAETRLSSSYDQMDQLALREIGDETLDQVCASQNFELFCDAVRELPVQCRRVFVLKKVYGHSQREIAELLEISEKTVEKHISKGIIRCRSYMKQRNSDPGHAESFDSISQSGDRQ